MDRQELLAGITRSVATCQKCRLYKTAKNPVPGEGSYETPLAFVGEAPGATEDETGRPFVGRAGKLLELLLKKIGYTREQVWIGNVIKHRPPDNRDPLPDEIKACEGYLTMQLKIINPKLVVTLGRYAMSYFYPIGKISQDRGNVINTKLFKVYPVYHPAAALRNPTMMKGLQEDFMRIPQVLKSVDDTRVIQDNKEGVVSEDGQLILGL